MMLRSSSTPHLESLLISSSPSPSIPPSPSNSILASFPRNLSSSAAAGFQNCSPAHDIRRTASTGNILSIDQPPDVHSPTMKRAAAPSLSSCSSFRRILSGAEGSPLFSIYSHELVEEEEEEEEKEEEEEEEEEEEYEEEYEEEEFVEESERFDLPSHLTTASDPEGTIAFPPLFLARGLGIDRVASGFFNLEGHSIGSNGGSFEIFSGNGGVMSDEEKHHRKMVEEHPRDALFLRNYAQFLYQTKGDYRRAEEYYSRAILADPSDGEILSQYAKLVWELHGDEERASSYFQQAVQATPKDCNVLAAYAGFLWETDEDDGGDEGCQPPHFSVGSPPLAGSIKRSCFV